MSETTTAGVISIPLYAKTSQGGDPYMRAEHPELGTFDLYEAKTKRTAQSPDNYIMHRVGEGRESYRLCGLWERNNRIEGTVNPLPDPVTGKDAPVPEAIRKRSVRVVLKDEIEGDGPVGELEFRPPAPAKEGGLFSRLKAKGGPSLFAPAATAKDGTTDEELPF